MDFSQKRAALENPSSLVYDRKFDTAIRDTFFQKFKSRLTPAPFENDRPSQVPRKRYDPHILEYLSKKGITEDQFCFDPVHYGVFLKKILDMRTLMNRNEGNRRLSPNYLLKLINQSVEVQTTYAHKHNYTFCKGSTLMKMYGWHQNLSMPLSLQNLIEVNSILSRLVDTSNEMFGERYQKLSDEEYKDIMSKKCTYQISSLSTTFYWSESLCIIVIDETVYCMPRCIILMYHNKISDLISVLSYAMFSSSSSEPSDAYDHTVRLLREMIKLLLKYKNGSFSIFKVLEGLISAETLLEVDEWVNDEFLTNICDELFEEIGYDYMSSSLRDCLLEADIPFRHELSCLSKILGHPLVSIKGGAKSLFTKTTEEVEINMVKVRECVHYFTRDYIKKHIHRHNKWPPCEILPKEAPRAIRMAQIYNKDPDSKFIVDKFGKTHIDHYVFIELKKNLEFNQMENILPHLKDKTISLLRSQVVGKYFDNIRPEREWENSRLLIAYLVSPNMMEDHKRYMAKFSSCTDFRQLLNYLVIKIVPKEKELKINFRGFGCMTNLNRFRLFVQEKNISHFMDEYIDEQTMTISELSILKRLDAFRRIQKAYKGYRVLYLVVDASSWNNRFSARTVDDMFKPTISRIFDEPTVSKVNEPYEWTFVYIPDDDEIYCWDGQRGGIEGQNQYSWMIAYIAQIKVAMQRFPYKYHILCKGDDLRIVVLIPEADFENNMLGGLKNQIVTEISEQCKQFGHKINIEESYGSAHYFAFSKSASIDTTELPQVYRKIQKCYGANNAFINVLDDYIASTFSNGHSACKVGTNTVPIYSSSLLWFYIYLLRHPLYSKLTDDQLVACSMVPSVVGGFPIIYLHNFSVRAESDLLSPFIDIYIYCRQYYYNVAEAMEHFFYLKDESPVNYKQIFIDPYCVPTSRPSLPSSILRSYIPAQLKRICKSKDILELMRLVKSPEQEYINEALSSCNVLRARALSVLYACTPEALLSEYLRQFESGKSVLDLLLLRRSRRQVHFILRRVLRGELRLQSWRYNRIVGKNLHIDVSTLHLVTECPNESANAIREFMFKKKVEDVSMPPLQHQMWMCYSGLSSYGDWIDNNHFNYTYLESEKQPVKTVDNRAHYRIGSFQPFLGYKTRTGQISPTVNFVEKDATLRKIRMIMEVCEWMNVSRVMPDGTTLISNIGELGKALLALYTDIDLSTLSPFSGKRKSGTAQHHMRSPNFRESIVPNVLSNTYTRIKGETNSHTRLTSSHQHFKVNFLHCYCHMVWLSTFELEFDKSTTVPHTFWGVTTNCAPCNDPIMETPLIFDEKLIIGISLPLLRIAKINLVAEGILTRSLEQDGLKVPNIRSDDNEITYQLACQGIISQVVNYLYNDRTTLMDRFTHNVLTDEGHNIMSILSGGGHDKDVGLTEIKAVSPEILVNTLLPIINQMIYTGLYSETEEDQQRWLLTTPIQLIPWYPLVSWLLSAGKLASVMTVCFNGSRLPVTGGYHDVYVATRYLGMCAIYCASAFRPNTNLVFLSHYQTNNIVIFVKSIIKYYRDKCVNSIDWNLVKRYDVRSSEDDKWMVAKYLLRYICLHRALALDDTMIMDLLEPVVKHTQAEVSLIDYDYITKDSFSMWLSELIDDPKLAKNRQVSGMINKLTLLYPEEAGDIVEKYLDEEMDTFIDYVITNASRVLPDISIHYVSLSDCISKVREHRAAGNEEDEEETRCAGEKLDELMENIRENRDNNKVMRLDQEIDDRPRLLEHGRLSSIDRLGVVYIGNVVSPDRPILHVVPTQALQYMLYGHSNNSQSSWYNLFSSLKPFNRKKTGMLTAVSLHDGLGGVTNVLDMFLSKSIIYYHTTTTEEYIYTPEPSDALNNQYLPNDNRILYEYLATGYTQLSSDEVVAKLVSVYKACDILTSDLEHPDPSASEYLYLMINVVSMMSRIMVVDSLCAIKLDLTGFSNCVIIVSLIRLLFTDIKLMLPHGDNYYNNVYVVASGKRAESRVVLNQVIAEIKNIITQGDLASLRNYEVADTYTNLSRHLRVCVGKLTTLMQSASNNDTILDANVYLTDQIYAIEYLGSYGYSKFVSAYKICPGHSVTTITEYFHLLRDAPNQLRRQVRIIELGIGMSNVINQIISDLQHGVKIRSKHKVWDTDTRAHRHVMLRQLYSMLGYQHCLEHVDIKATHIVFSYTRLKEALIKHMEAWVPRDVRREEIPTMEMYDMGEDFGEILSLEYNKGIEICLSLLLYSHLLNRRHNYDKQ